MKMYDLVKIIGNNGFTRDFNGAIGIITEIKKKDQNGEHLHYLIFAGEHHNKLSEKLGGYSFYVEELEGI